MRRRTTLLAILGIGVVLVGSWLTLAWLSSPPATAECPSATEGVTLEDLTLSAGGAFSHGSIQAFGSNGTSVILGGLSEYHRGAVPFDSQPAAVELDPQAAPPVSENLTLLLSPYFEGGGIFPVVWNGSAWLIAGQTTVDNGSEGALVVLHGGSVTNRTSLVAPYFSGQGASAGEGIWIAGWDGSGWLLGGNSSAGAALVYLQGDHVQDLSALLPHNRPGDWIQMLAWNGTGWAVGGQGVFGTWYQDRYTDLLPSSPFRSGGVYALDWNGTAWWAGGAPAGLAEVEGERVVPGPALGPAFNGWVNTVLTTDRGMLVAGGGYGAGGYVPQLALLEGDPHAPVTVDLSACLPAAFRGGWVQFGAPAPAYSPSCVLLVGQGGTDAMTLESHGAAVLVQWSPPPSVAAGGVIRPAGSVGPGALSSYLLRSETPPPAPGATRP